jgi:hypothetical protein
VGEEPGLYSAILMCCVLCVLCVCCVCVVCVFCVGTSIPTVRTLGMNWDLHLAGDGSWVQFLKTSQMCCNSLVCSDLTFLGHNGKNYSTGALCV